MESAVVSSVSKTVKKKRETHMLLLNKISNREEEEEEEEEKDLAFNYRPPEMPKTSRFFPFCVVLRRHQVVCFLLHVSSRLLSLFFSDRIEP